MKPQKALMFKQQLIGILHLSLIAVIACSILPTTFLFSVLGKLFVALLIGAYVFYLNWKQVHGMVRSLLYAPTHPWKAHYEQLIRGCGIDPATVMVRYAYTNESTALAADRTIILDPVIFTIQDPEAAKVLNVFEQHIKPTLKAAQIERLSASRTAMTPAAEQFIFRHELGHIVRHITPKRLISNLVTSAAAAYTALAGALAVTHIHPWLAIVVGIAIGFVTDLVYTMLANVTWRLYEEKAADKFAARYSSRAEISAAATFFAKHQEILDHYSEPNIMARLPSELKTGHPNGKTRANYLLNLAVKSN